MHSENNDDDDKDHRHHDHNHIAARTNETHRAAERDDVHTLAHGEVVVRPHIRQSVHHKVECGRDDARVVAVVTVVDALQRDAMAVRQPQQHRESQPRAPHRNDEKQHQYNTRNRTQKRTETRDGASGGAHATPSEKAGYSVGNSRRHHKDMGGTHR
jgi:hypothetical protein